MGKGIGHSVTLDEASSWAGALRRKRRIKWCGSITLIVLLAIYLWFARRWGDLGIREGVPYLNAGDFVWLFYPSPRLFMAILGSLGFVIWLVLARPRSWQPMRPMTRFIATGMVLSWTGYLVVAQRLSVPYVDPLGVITILAVGFIVAYILANPNDSPTILERAGNWLAEPPRWFVWTVALGGGAAMALMGWVLIFDRYPVFLDSYSQIAQARILIQGNWVLDIPQSLANVIAFPAGTETVPIYSQYPPGHILLLTIPMILGLPVWMISFVTAVGMVGLTTLIAYRLGRAPSGLLAAVLIIGGSWYVVVSATMMNHTSTAFCLTGAAACFMPWLRRGECRRNARFWLGSMALGGFLLGWAVITRPMTGLAHAIAWTGIWLTLMWRAWLHRRRGAPISRQPERRPLTLCLGLGMVTMGLVFPAATFLYYNTQTTGNPFVMPYQTVNPDRHQLGFNPNPVEGKFGPREMTGRLVTHFMSFNRWMYGWAIGSLTALAIWGWRTRLRLPERLILLIIVTQFLLYGSYHRLDQLLGSRFLYEIFPFVTILAALGLGPILGRGGWRAGTIWIVVLMLAVGGLSRSIPFWKHRFSRSVTFNRLLDEVMVRPQLNNAPTVLVVHDPLDVFMPRYFPPLPGERPIWFILARKADQARRLPELTGYQWFRLDPTGRNLERLDPP